MRRTKQALNKNEINKILEKGEYGIFSTIGAEGYPYGLPLSYVWDGSVIYFHCFLEGLKLDNMKRNAKCCVTVVGDTKVLPKEFTTEYESVIVFGEGSLVEDKEEKLASLMKLSEKYSMEAIDAAPGYIEKFLPKTTIIKVTPIHMTGKTSKE